MNVQISEKNGQPEWAVIPFKEYERLQQIQEDAEDIKDIDTNMKAMAEGRETAIPGEVTFAIIDGVNPVRAWRQYQQIKMNILAERIGITPGYLSQIENKNRNPTINTLRRIADELNIDIEMLI